MADDKWRADCISVIKAAMAKETDEVKLRDMANALSGLVPYTPENVAPQPVMVVEKPKRRWGKGGKRKKGKK